MSDDAIYSFDANYEVDGASRAERLYYVRMLYTDRPFSTFGPPLLLLLLGFVSPLLVLPDWFKSTMIGIAVVSVILPICFCFLRSLVVGRVARKYPLRRVEIGPSAVEIAFGSRKAITPFTQIKHAWVAGDYIVLVCGKFASLSIPLRDLPDGAREYLFRSVGHA